MSIEAMKQALEALDELNAQAGFFPDELHLEHPTIIKSEKAITSLRQAIATEESLATQEPKREWVGLTLDERLELAKDIDWAVGAYCEYAEAVEAKLKEKNNAA